MSPRPVTPCPLGNPRRSVLPVQTGHGARQGALQAVGKRSVSSGPKPRVWRGRPADSPGPARPGPPPCRPRCCHGNRRGPRHRRAPPAASGRGRSRMAAGPADQPHSLAILLEEPPTHRRLRPVSVPAPQVRLASERRKKRS